MAPHKHACTMDEDIKNLKPYLNNLKRSLQELRPELERLNRSSLNDRLIQTSSEFKRLEITNTYAYILNSLLFAYIKLVNAKGLNENIMLELQKCKKYITSANEIKAKNNKVQSNEIEQNKLIKQNIIKSLNKNSTARPSPSISSKNFTKAKHTKFDQNEDSFVREPDENNIIKEKIIQNQKNKKKSSKMKSGKISKK